MAYSNDKPSSIARIRIAFGIGLCSLLLVLLVHGGQRKSVRAELVGKSEQNGPDLSQVSNNGIYTVDFAARSLENVRQFISKGTADFGALSFDGAEIAFSYCAEPGLTHPTPFGTGCPAGHLHLGIVRTDGSDFREYSGLVYPFGFCWSHDKSKLALTVSDRRESDSPEHNLGVMDLSSGQIRDVAGKDNWTTSQCWSPDDKQMVYSENKVGGVQNVLLFDIEKGKSSFIAKGSKATWSPDGNWIAFLDNDDTYCVIRPDGSGKRMLFKTTVGDSELWWSPDSKFVAYVSARSFLERWPTQEFAELSRLRIRRLDDGSEDWFLNLSAEDAYWFQWVRP
jgi:hypothetical protein